MKKQYSTKKALMASVLALCLCFSMLVGTTFAWFTDSVTSSGNIIQTGTLNVEMYWADGGKEVPAKGAADWINAASGAMFDYTNWEPGYAVARHILIANEGSLALNYKLRIVADGVVTKLADVIDVYYFADAKVPADADFVADNWLGTLTDILGTDKNLSKTVCGGLEAGDIDNLTLVLKMQETAGNEYQDMELSSGFKVELIATQRSSEADSFGPDYDLNDETTVVVPSPEIPAAVVRELDDLKVSVGKTSEYGDLEGNLTLNAGYQFQPTQSVDEAKASEYRHWHADYVVSADRDVPANSVVLAGYYSAFCDLGNNGNWVALTSPADVAAGTEIRLVQSMGNGSISVSYQDLCLYGNDGKGFQCGIGAVDEAAAKKLAGTTVTVELRMYETKSLWSDSSINNEETGNYITIGEFTYTFPAIEVSTLEELNSVLEAGGSVALTADIAVNGNLTLKDGAAIYGNGKTLSNVSLHAGDGAVIENVVFDGVAPNTNNNASHVYASGSITVDGCTFTNSNWDALQLTPVVGSELVITNCVFGAGNAWRSIHVEPSKDVRSDSNNGITLVLEDNYIDISRKAKEKTNYENQICIIGVYDITANNNTIVYAGEKLSETAAWTGVHVNGKQVYWDDETMNKNLAFSYIRPISSLDALNTFVSEGGKAVLSADITLPDETSYLTLKDGKSYDIDLGGHTITAKETKNGFVFRIESGATLNLSNGTIVSSGYAIFSGKNTGTVNNLVMDNVTVKAELVGVYHNGSTYGLNAVIKNSTITAETYAGVWLSGSASWGKDLDNCHSLVIDNCTITGDTAVEVMYTNAKISNSTLTSTAVDSEMDTDGGASANGFALALTHQTDETALGIVEVTNCTLNGIYGIQTEGTNYTTENTTTAAIIIQ